MSSRTIQNILLMLTIISWVSLLLAACGTEEKPSPIAIGGGNKVSENSTSGVRNSVDDYGITVTPNTSSKLEITPINTLVPLQTPTSISEVPTVLPTVTPTIIQPTPASPAPSTSTPIPGDNPIQDQKFIIRSIDDVERCLELFKANNTDNISILNWKCADYRMQWFNFKNGSIISLANSLCLDIDEESIKNKDKQNTLVFKTCNEISAYQKFNYDISSGHIVNNILNKCVGISSNGSKNPDDVYLEECKSSSKKQKFEFIAQNITFKQIMPAYIPLDSEKCLELSINESAQSFFAYVADCNNLVENQFLIFQDDGTIKIKNTSLCLSKDSKNELRNAICNPKDKGQLLSYDNVTEQITDAEGLCLNIEGSNILDSKVSFITCSSSKNQKMHLKCNDKNPLNVCVI